LSWKGHRAFGFHAACRFCRITLVAGEQRLGLKLQIKMDEVHTRASEQRGIFEAPRAANCLNKTIAPAVNAAEDGDADRR